MQPLKSVKFSLDLPSRPPRNISPSTGHSSDGVNTHPKCADVCRMGIGALGACGMPKWAVFVHSWDDGMRNWA